MKKQSIAIMLMLMGITLSCQSSAEENPSATNSEQVEAHKDAVNRVTLNEGMRWEADATTKAGIEEMQSILVQYQEGEITGVDTLQKHLQQTFSDIFAQCTMKGAAHEQLHNYLLPMKDHLSQLNTCEETHCEAIIQNLEKHLHTFSTYFQ